MCPCSRKNIDYRNVPSSWENIFTPLCHPCRCFCTFPLLLSPCVCEYSSTGWIEWTFCCATHYQTYKWLLHITHLRFFFFTPSLWLSLSLSLSFARRLPLPLSLHTFMRVKFISSSWIHFSPVTSGTSTTIHLANVLCPWTEPMSLYLALCTRTDSAVLFLSLSLFLSLCVCLYFTLILSFPSPCCTIDSHE